MFAKKYLLALSIVCSHTCSATIISCDLLEKKAPNEPDKYVIIAGVAHYGAGKCEKLLEQKQEILDKTLCSGMDFINNFAKLSSIDLQIPCIFESTNEGIKDLVNDSYEDTADKTFYTLAKRMRNEQEMNAKNTFRILNYDPRTQEDKERPLYFFSIIGSVTEGFPLVEPETFIYTIKCFEKEDTATLKEVNTAFQTSIDQVKNWSKSSSFSIEEQKTLSDIAEEMQTRKNNFFSLVKPEEMDLKGIPAICNLTKRISPSSLIEELKNFFYGFSVLFADAGFYKQIILQNKKRNGIMLVVGGQHAENLVKMLQTRSGYKVNKKCSFCWLEKVKTVFVQCSWNNGIPELFKNTINYFGVNLLKQANNK